MEKKVMCKDAVQSIATRPILCTLFHHHPDLPAPPPPPRRRYVILSGCSPFSADEEELLLKQVAEAKYEFFENEWKNISDDAKDIIRRLLVADPANRMTMPELLEHPWVKASVDKCREEIERKLQAAPPAAAAAAKPKKQPKVVSDRKLTKGCPKMGCPKPCCNPKACCSIM